jgi:hypothetical protein
MLKVRFDAWQSAVNLQSATGLSLVVFTTTNSRVFSALINLHDPNGSRTDPEHFQFTLDLLKPVADAMSWDSAVFLSGRFVSVNDASPLLLFWAYQAGTIHQRQISPYNDEALQLLEHMKTKLVVMSSRWRASSKFPLFYNGVVLI